MTQAPDAPRPDVLHDTQALIALFVKTTDGMTSREVERATNNRISDGTVQRMRNGDTKRLFGTTREAMIDYLRRRGVLPTLPEPGAFVSMEEYEGNRAHAAIQHLGSKAVRRAMGWALMDVSSALTAYATEQGFSDTEMQTLRNWIRLEQEEGGQ